MATYWENSCSFGLRYVSWYKYLIVSLVFSHLGFWSGNLFLIAPFPDLCLLVPLYTKTTSLSELGARFDCNLNRWLVGTAYIRDTCMFDCIGTAPVFPMMFTFWSASLHYQNLLNLVICYCLMSFYYMFCGCAKMYLAI